MDFSNALLIDAPACAVFDYLAHPENLPRWNYALSRTEQTSPGPTGVGATFRQTRTLPRPAQESFTITVFEPPNCSLSRASSGRSAERRPTRSPTRPKALRS